MLIDKLKFLQGYVKIKLSGYAPERFLNLCSNHNILIWNLEYEEDNYVFCISVRGLKRLKPILRKTRTKFVILERVGLPFLMSRYRKRKLFFAGIFLCCGLLYTMSLFIWKIEIHGNLHETDSNIIKFLEKNQVYHGRLKSKIDCEKIEEELRAGYGDIIWASAKLEGTMLIIDIQENLAANQQASKQAEEDTGPSDLIADKDAVIYSILTRQGTPYVEKGSEVHPGDLLVEGKNPVLNDSGEVASYQYCVSDADILGITQYMYEDQFSMGYEDKVFTGEESAAYGMRLWNLQMKLPHFFRKFSDYDVITNEYPVKIGETFYLPLLFTKETCKEYKTEKKRYSKQEAEQAARAKLEEFCAELTQKGVQIIENNVMIVTDGKNCTASGTIKVIEPIGTRKDTTITEIPQEGQIEDESDGNRD
ncbi:MAG: sporulation protein YqfD [Lachnospiraceae bacterium]|nr:sporulation protein YqfD [Lachnospiraceae bacterium]